MSFIETLRQDRPTAERYYDHLKQAIERTEYEMDSAFMWLCDRLRYRDELKQAMDECKSALLEHGVIILED